MLFHPDHIGKVTSFITGIFTGAAADLSEMASFVKRAVSNLKKDAANVQYALDHLDDILSEGIELGNPSVEDLVKARNVVETILWFQENYGFQGHVAVNPAIIRGAVPNLSEKPSYGEAAMDLFKAMGDISGWSLHMIENFLEFADECRDVCEEHRISFAHIREGGTPSYFKENMLGKKDNVHAYVAE